MTQWNPDWKIYIDGVEFTDVTLNNVSITSGRTDPFTQPYAGYASFELLNLANSSYNFTINSIILIELKNSSNNYIPIFGGWISDYSIGVDIAGTGYVTTAKIYALGSLAKLNRIIDANTLSEDLEGNQILQLLETHLPQDWEDVPPALLWQNYQAGVTWAEALSGIGNIDTGQYTMIGKNTDPVNLYSYITQIAQSANGIVYEDVNGNIAYDDYLHRQTYVSTNGWTSISANNANFAGISETIRIGDIRNKLTINYGNNANSSYTAEDATSQDDYGLYAATETYLLKNTTDAQSVATRYIKTRKNPYPRFEQITYQLANPELDDADRNALIGIFNGMPVQITDLPSNIADGEFFGFVEGWTFRSGVNSCSLTFFASPRQFSAVDYELYATYTSNATFTVPAGVSEIAVYAVGGGGNGAAGGAAASGLSGYGGAGGGGGGGAIMWHYPVTPGQTYSVVIGGSNQNTTFGSTVLVAGAGSNATTTFPGGNAAGSSTATNYVVTDAGLGSSGQTGVSGVNGGDGLYQYVTGKAVADTIPFPSGFGLPTDLRIGQGACAGGSGGHANLTNEFYMGGLGGTTGGAIGGAGGEATVDPSFINGLNGANGAANTGAGGGGGGGGGRHPTGGIGIGGSGGSGASGKVIVYTR